MRLKRLNAIVIIGALIYGVLNLGAPGFLMVIAFAAAFGDQDGSANSFVTTAMGGSVLLWFLLPIASGYLVSHINTKKAQRAGQTVDARTAQTWGALTTVLGQVPVWLFALSLVAHSISETRDPALGLPVVLFAIAVTVISGLLGGGGGRISFRFQSA